MTESRANESEKDMENPKLHLVDSEPAILLDETTAPARIKVIGVAAVAQSVDR